jgi:hypothetical protein
LNVRAVVGNGVRSAGNTPVDVADIYSRGGEEVQELKGRGDLRPAEQAVSLPPPATATPGPHEPLTRFLGPLLTVANPAWSGNPVPRLRALQKKLVERSLALDQDDRRECMAALSVVETAVQLRLRFQQMRMTEAEKDLSPEPGKPK